MKRLVILMTILFTILLGFGCNSKQKRWYSIEQVQTGKKVFLKHCAVCHGKEAQGLTNDWRKPLADKSYPPPPLNGTAHAFHHPLSDLKKSINLGGLSQSGKMPAFKDKLKENEKLSVIAYFQSFWSDEIYNIWLKRSGIK